jgi:hypothetical protein
MVTLAELVRDHGALAVRDAIGWTLRTAKTLADMHDAGETHGALCAEAIMVERADCTSPGALLSRDDVEQPAAYVAPDRDGRARAEADDVWALAVTLYFALTGELPYPDGPGSGARAVPQLGRVRPELSTIQPLMDALLDTRASVARVQAVIAHLERLAPVAADLPPLELVRGPDAEGLRPEAAPPPSPSRQAAAPAAKRRPLGGLVLLTLVVIIALVVALSRRGSEGVDTAPAPTDAAGSDRPAPAPSPRPAASSAASSAVAPSAASSSGGEETATCVARLLAPGAFRPSVALDPLCHRPQPRPWAMLVTEAVVRKSGGAPSEAAREWVALGWYQPAALAAARGRCCAARAAVEVPALWAPCGFAEALEAFSTAAEKGDDAALAAAVTRYGVAASCLHTAGAGRDLGYTERPNEREAAVLLRVLNRMRRAPR